MNVFLCDITSGPLLVHRTNGDHIKYLGILVHMLCVRFSQKDKKLAVTKVEKM